MSGQASFVSALLDPGLPCPGELRAWNHSDVARRFAVYRNNVLASLTNSLADTFPVVHALVGPEFFRAMAAVFVRSHPPRSPVLAQYGDGFAHFIAGFEPAAGVPYLADVARLEMARVEAFHAADGTPPDAADAAPLLAHGHRAGEVQLLLHPSVRLVQSTHPVVSIWAAHQGEGELESLDLGCAEAALVVRPALDVLTLRLDKPAATFVACLLRRDRLGESAAAASLAGDSFDLAAVLALLMRHGALMSIRMPERECDA